MNSSPWLVHSSGATASPRLYCFPYAGGSAGIYLPWQSMGAGAIDICAIELPGRGRRMAEPPMTALEDIVAAIAQAIGTQNQQPFAFFGHSLGALLAFEVARYLQRHGLAQPIHLVVSGCASPDVPSDMEDPDGLTDAQFIDVLRSLNGTPEEILSSAELMAMVLPMLRADFSLACRYDYTPQAPLTVPLTVLAGRADADTTQADLAGWRRETTLACRQHWFDGDHFFLHSQADAVFECVMLALQSERAQLARPKLGRALA